MFEKGGAASALEEHWSAVDSINYNKLSLEQSVMTGTGDDKHPIILPAVLFVQLFQTPRFGCQGKISNHVGLLKKVQTRR